MDINPTSQTAQRPTEAPASQAEEDKAALSSDFETFLTLLTAQLENQDPLNPMESQDFAVQLATFSGVEQQVRTNDLLEKMAGGGTLGGLSDVSRLVGLEVRAPVPTAFTGDPVDLFADLPDGTDQATLAVRDEGGILVSRVAVDAGGGPYMWDGTDAQGARVPDGIYSFRIETMSEGVPGEAIVPEVFSRVIEARLDGDASLLVFSSGETLAADAATAVRIPASEGERSP